MNVNVLKPQSTDSKQSIEYAVNHNNRPEIKRLSSVVGARIYLHTISIIMKMKFVASFWKNPDYATSYKNAC